LLIVLQVTLYEPVGADTDSPAEWPVEATANWNAVFGRVAGIDLESGDSIGMFDENGNCFGAGIYDGTYFFLSAYQEETGDEGIPGDFEIPGFKEGDRVIFKLYKKSEGKEYDLNTASGSGYIYSYHGNFPPERIDLVYTGGEGYEPTEPDPYVPLIPDKDPGDVLSDDTEKLPEGAYSPIEDEIEVTAEEEGYNKSLDEPDTIERGSGSDVPSGGRPDMTPYPGPRDPGSRQGLYDDKPDVRQPYTGNASPYGRPEGSRQGSGAYQKLSLNKIERKEGDIQERPATKEPERKGFGLDISWLWKILVLALIAGLIIFLAKRFW